MSYTRRSYSDLRVGGSYYTSIGIAVSSRIPFLAGPVEGHNKPLRGVRFAVKDIFDIKGLHVTAGNRAYYSVSSPAEETCAAIQRLLDAGAELTGTLRLGSLIAREEPAESVDYHAPFNPRGDGYQSAWSSSSGSGAAIAAYDWLDFTIAQDSEITNAPIPLLCPSTIFSRALHNYLRTLIATGSSRRPVMANGCFGIRISQEAIPLEGVVPSFP